MSVSIPCGDTDPAVAEVLVARFRSMTIAERVDLIERLHRDIEALAVAGIRRDHPDLDDRGCLRELARRRFGPELADAA